MNQSSGFDIDRELRRIGVDGRRFGGFAWSSTPISGDDLLAWLRRLPTGLGHAAFMKALEKGGLRGAADQGMPPRDPSFATPDIDLREAFMTELKRVLPNDMVDHGWAIITMPDMAEAVAKLRTLPDRAGWDVVSSVLPLVKVL